MLPREKFLKWGISSLSLYELIAIIISSGTNNHSVFDISKEVEKVFKREYLSLNTLRRVKGLGDVKAMKLLSVWEIAKRLNSKNDNLEKIFSSEKAYETLRYIGKYKQEHFVCIFLNARYEVLAKKVVAIGSVDSVHVLPRDIILKGLKFNSIFVIMAHNHPSGDCTPSEEDVLVTKRIKESLELVGMQLLDHLIIGNNSWKRVEII